MARAPCRSWDNPATAADLEDAGEEDGRLARGSPRAAADVVVEARLALAHDGVAGPGADAAGGLAATRARTGGLLDGGWVR